MLGDDPPYLSVGTEVSAKYKGAFCEAKIRKVVRSVKCRVTYKQGLGTATVTDDQIKGTLRVGASVDARHNDRKDFVEATITKIQDCSQYTVVFDDGDITTLRRTALCLKSGRHFAESETLDQLPLTHPEHFGNPVIGGRRGRRSRQTQDESSEDEDSPPHGSNESGIGGEGKEGLEIEPEIGRVVCVELGDKKKKDNWFPGLVVAPTAQDTVRIRVKDDYLVRSFKDARYYTVPKKEATEFTKDLVNKVENSALKVAVEKALLFLEKNELPPHWDKDSLFGNSASSGNSDSDGDIDSDSSDDEPREEKDHFVAQLYKFMDDRGTPINNCPMIGEEDIDLYRLFRAVYKLGGYNRVTNQNQWKIITRRLSFSMQSNPATHNLVKQAYKKFLHSFEDFYRKLGCTMVNHPRGSVRKQRPGRSLIRDKDRNTPVPPQVKSEKEDEEKEKKVEEEKKEKREIKKEIKEVKEEEPPKPVRKKEKEKEKDKEKEKEREKEREKEKERDREKEKEREKEREREREKEKEKEKENERDREKEREREKEKEKEKEESESLSGQESDVHIEEEESSSSENSKKTSRFTSILSRGKPKEDKKVKDEKKKVFEKKKVDPKKQEKKEEKLEKREEDTTKTRSKSKDDATKAKPNADARESRTPSREPEKKPFSKQRRLTEEEMKKKGRKRKDTDGEKSRSDEQSVDYAPSYKGPVELGDRLKVYYGPNHESKVTYEAKVIDMEKDGTEPSYLVHYTGWNTRYDEWINGSRIAQNFTQTPGRVKRPKTTPRPQTPGASSSGSGKSIKAAGLITPGSQTRRRALSVAPSSGTPSMMKEKREDKEKDKEGSIRSTTPLLGTRTKSPATPATGRLSRATRNAESVIELRRRTRRMSGHTDVTAASESEETDSYESDTESEQTRGRSKEKEEGNRREAKRRAETKIKMEASEGEDEKEIVEEPRRGRRLRRNLGKILPEVKSEPESDDEQPKGRDFDLNQIRSELKGFDKAVKLEMLRVEPEPEEGVKQTVEKESPEKLSVPMSPKAEKLEKVDKVEKIEKVEKKQEPIKVEKKPEPAKVEPILEVKAPVESTEDIYEFKEPEPFEFEVRNKSGGDKDKLKRRVFEDPVKSSPKKKQKMSLSPKETKAEVDNSENRKKVIRKSFGRKIEEPEEGASTSRPLLQSSWKCEEAFDKLCESTAYNQPKPPQVEDSSRQPANIDLLFTDLPGDDDAADDPEDRLIISETECPEVEQENIFSYQQEIFPPNDLDVDFKEDKKPKTQVQREKPQPLPPPSVIESKPVAPIESKSTLSLIKPILSPKIIEPKLLETKPLDFPSVLSPAPTVPVPISARLPVTSSIEEKLSAAAAFRNKVKDTKKDDNGESSKKLGHFKEKEMRKAESASMRRSKEETKTKIEAESKKISEEPIMKPITKPDPEVLEEKARSPLIVTKVKDEVKKIEKRVEIENSSQKLDLRKFTEQKTQERLEEKWKKSEEKIFQEEDRKIIEVEKQKSAISVDFADSTDSSDSEQRLIIDNEVEFNEEKPSKFEVKLNLERDSIVKQNLERDSIVKTQEKSSSLKLNQERTTNIKLNQDRASNLKLNQERVSTFKNLERNSPLKMNAEKSSTLKNFERSSLKANTEKSSNTKPNLETSSTLKVLPNRGSSLKPIEFKLTPKINVISVPEMERNLKELPLEEVKPMIQNQVRLQQAGLQCKFTRAEEEVENLNSLLCEEEIPGSPTPGTETIDQEVAGTSHTTPKAKIVDSSIVLMEMPFASAPTSSPTSCGPISTLSMSLPQSSSAMVPVPLAVQHVPMPVRQEHPAPVQRQESNEAAPVMDNTPPTTPDSSISNLCESPREAGTAGSSPMSEDSSKLNRDTSEVDNDSKLAGLSEDEASLLNSEGNGSDRPLKQSLKRAMEESGAKKRKRNRSHIESGGNNLGKKSPRLSGRSSRYGAGSDSDDTSEGSNQCSSGNLVLTGHGHINSITELNSYSSRSPRPTKYNFYVELDPEWDGSQRIAVLQQKLSDLRKTYNSVKVELAGIERRRKKLKRREREALKAAKAEMQQACS